MGLFWGALADRIGRKPLMVLGFAGHAVSTAALAFVETPAQYIALMIANQVSASAWNPAARAMVADVTPADRRGRAYGLLYLANNLGISLGLLIATTSVILSLLVLWWWGRIVPRDVDRAPPAALPAPA